jgi:F-type H+-transporting ATPase subunit gamma
MAAEASRPYADRMSKVLSNLASGVKDNPNAPALLAGTGKNQTHLLVVCTAERGLCGAFNSSIARLARDKAQALMAEGKTVKIVCVGKKGYDILKRQFSKQIIEFIEFRSVRSIGFEQADQVGQFVLSHFAKGEFDVCTLFFSRFRSVIAQIPTAMQLIPAQVDESKIEPSLAVYDYEPSDNAILETLLPRNVSMQIFSALLENAASEQGARMSAMDSATRNAGEMIKKQTMLYNRTRQAMITKELIEIISGAEAL